MVADAHIQLFCLHPSSGCLCFLKYALPIHARLHISLFIPVCEMDARIPADCPFFSLLTLRENAERRSEALVVLMAARLLFFNAAGTIFGSLLSMMDDLGHSCHDIYGAYCIITWIAGSLQFGHLQSYGGSAGLESVVCVVSVGGLPELSCTTYSLDGSTSATPVNMFFFVFRWTLLKDCALTEWSVRRSYGRELRQY